MSENTAGREWFMAKAHVDPAELRRFALDLNRFNNELQTLMGGLNARLHGLEGSWRDQEHRKFFDAFDQTMKVLAGFLEASQQHVSFLGKKASLIEEYLKQR
ncbi:MAG TPA: WXG100 family type VII secretion target [Phycisphaerae bacterium]|nr:WXG100 family type VII secretion target [Phycisphaerae bacterium]HRY68498.1 WXG100 family type VII secretion target [Phycisphaerae bacterium]HSA25546.1 WXG100 family type VII secretion target [Phycisphaerae bacterium]